MPDEHCIEKIIKLNDEERRSRLTDEEIDIIASRIQNKMYEQIGKNVVAKLFWLVGIASVSVWAFVTHIYPKL